MSNLHTWGAKLCVPTGLSVDYIFTKPRSTGVGKSGPVSTSHALAKTGDPGPDPPHRGPPRAAETSIFGVSSNCAIWWTFRPAIPAIRSELGESRPTSLNLMWILRRFEVPRASGGLWGGGSSQGSSVLGNVFAIKTGPLLMTPFDDPSFVVIPRPLVSPMQGLNRQLSQFEGWWLRPRKELFGSSRCSVDAGGESR